MRFRTIAVLPLTAVLSACVCFTTSGLERDLVGVVPTVDSISSIESRFVYYFNDELTPSSDEFHMGEAIESTLQDDSLVLDGGGPRVEIEVIDPVESSIPMVLLSAWIQ